MTPPPTLQELIDMVCADASSQQPLDQLVAAADAVSQLEETSDALLGHFVDRCRRDGQSWSQISAALGVTKQAVHKRFSTAIADRIFSAIAAPTFDRFTPRARHVVAAAQQIALDHGENAVGTEHLLLGLFTEPAGIAGRVLVAMNVTEEIVRAAVPASASAAKPSESGGSGQPAERASKAAHALSDEAERALRDTLAVALELGHNYVGTEHILLGFYRNDEAAAAKILVSAGALEATARGHVIEMLTGLGQT